MRKRIAMDISRLQEIDSYCGLRHKKKLLIRGQRTRINAYTHKGPRKVGNIIALKKKIIKK